MAAGPIWPKPVAAELRTSGSWSCNSLIKADTASLADRRALTVQFAEANLRAGRHQRARELFASLLSTAATAPRGGRSIHAAVPTTQDQAASNPSLDDVRVILGYAEALFQLDEFALALPKFNRLATGLLPSDPIRWKSLLRDLQCRTSLRHPAQGIVKVIQQQRQLYPELGGSVLARQLEKLQRQNERILDEGS